MNVGQLRKSIAHLPDDMPVVTDHECGLTYDLSLYLIPACRQHDYIGSGYTTLDGYENITALHLSGYGCADEAVDITPKMSPSVIDGELIRGELS